MKIKFIKDYISIDTEEPSATIYSPGNTLAVSDDDEVVPEAARWLINNGFAEEVKESGWWKPEEGHRYFYFSDGGFATSKTWRGTEEDLCRYKMGNCFKTQVAATNYGNYMEAIATVRQDEGVLTPEEVIDASNRRDIVGQLTIGDNARDLEACICVFIVKYPVVGAIYFDTKEHAKSSLDNHPDEWKTIANYDWGRE